MHILNVYVVVVEVVAAAAISHDAAGRVEPALLLHNAPAAPALVGSIDHRMHLLQQLTRRGR